MTSCSPARPARELQAHRVPEVIDAWFDSGSMPFAQWGYPWNPARSSSDGLPGRLHRRGHRSDPRLVLLAHGGRDAGLRRVVYRNVLCLGHILADDGRKMSKHLGNILEPIPLMDAHGADAVRWFMVAESSPWASRRVGHAAIGETVRKVLLTYWNTVAFASLYARGAAGWTPTGEAPAVESRHVLDRWLTSATNRLVVDVTAALNDFDTQTAGSRIIEFIDDLSNWYVRRSRHPSGPAARCAVDAARDPARADSGHGAHHPVRHRARVLAEACSSRPATVPSVHLATWPTEVGYIDERLEAAMKQTRRLVELGRSARSEASVEIRQPLRRLMVPSAALAQLSEDLLGEITAELNVTGSVESFASAGDLVDYSAKGNFRALGKRFGKHQTPIVAQAIADANAAGCAAARRRTATMMSCAGPATSRTPTDVILSNGRRAGPVVNTAVDKSPSTTSN